jgi:uncharacterized protein (TIGR00730 family)
MISSLVVFCGSKNGNNPLFTRHAAAIGEWVGKAKITLVYGGGNKGLMGTVANAALAENGKVIGVIPEVLVSWEHAHNGLTELKVVPDMHIRKKIMYELADAAIILPGGNGTMDELFELLTWNTLNIHDKKIFIMNTAGYYDSLIAHQENVFKEGFLYENWNERMVICDKPEMLFEKIQSE